MAQVRIRSANSWLMFLIVVLGVCLGLIGGYKVAKNKEIMRLKREVYIQIIRYGRLVEERDNLIKNTQEVMSKSRLAFMARELLDMRRPKPEETIVLKIGDDL